MYTEKSNGYYLYISIYSEVIINEYRQQQLVPLKLLVLIFINGHILYVTFFFLTIFFYKLYIYNHFIIIYVYPPVM